jgi:hypothetical protein
VSAYDYWNREELYQEVWSAAMWTLAKKYGISDVGLAKVCRKLNIPLPGRGYWAKKQAGQTVKQLPLPAMKEPPKLQKPTPRKEPPSSAQTADDEERILLQRLTSSKGTDALKRGSLSHALIVQAGSVLRKERADGREILWSRERCLDIQVSRAGLDRAIRVMAGFIELAEAEGFSVVIGDEQREATSLVAFGHSVKFGLMEKVQRLDISAVATGTALNRVLTYGGKPVEYRPTGEFYMEAFGVWDGHQKKWKEGKAGTMEEILPNVLAGLLRIALARRAEKIRQEAEQNEQRRIAEIREQLQTAIRAEQAKVRDLRHLTADWTRAEQLRAFVAAAHNAGIQHGQSCEVGTPFGDWLAWAEQQADRLDPLKESPISIIDRRSELVAETSTWYRKPDPPFRFTRPVWRIGFASASEPSLSEQSED